MNNNRKNSNNIKDNNFQLVINGNAFSMSTNQYGYTEFEIIRSNHDV